MATRSATNARAVGLPATIGPMTLRGMNNNSVLPDARADHSCRYSRSMAISPKTSPALRTPRLVSFSPSEANTRIKPDLTINMPVATSPAVHTVSPNASSRDCALWAKLSMAARVSAESSSTDARNSTRDWISCVFDWVSCVFMGQRSKALVGLDDVFRGPGPQPLLAQQPPHLGGGVVVEAGRMLCVHPEDLESRPIPRCERSQQVAGGGVEYFRLDVGPERSSQQLADQAALLPSVGDRMLARHLVEAIGVLAEHRDHLLGLGLGIENDMAHLDAVKLRRVQLEVPLYGLVAADLAHHLFLIQAVGDEGLELRQTDAHRIEVLVRVGRPVQAAHPAKLVGAFLDFRLRHLDARFPRA